MSDTKPTIHEDAAVEALRRASRLDPHLLKRFRYAFYQLGHPVDELLSELPAGPRAQFAAGVDFHVLQLERQELAVDGAIKLVFRTRQGRLLESVILGRHTRQRTTLCVSSQVGCAANCCFCATGQMPQIGNLSASEIVDQVVQANLALRNEGRKIRNVVFMGMGEPLHNEYQVFEAAALLFSQRHFNLSPRRTLLSTVGIPDAMIRWARRFRRSPLALSLHAARQDLREQLIPLARRYPLPLLRETLCEVLAIQHAPLMIEYLLLGGVNDSLDDAAQLAEFLAGLPVLINLIPFNPVAHAPHLQSSDRSRGSAFAARLRGAGFLVTFRHSLGRDVRAACGQLIQSLGQQPHAV
jgi:23S rRNA (adenine2503-C2)-methyltransferase